MKLIVGLGNPGEGYASTRHNAGFMFLDYLAQRVNLDEPYSNKDKFKAVVGRKHDWLLAKPNTFMNQSGQAVAALVNFYKLSLDDLFVVHDDLDLLLGNWKLQQGIGPKVHNGILSIEQQLGRNDFWRLRFGVDSRTAKQREVIKGEDYVLAKMGADERSILKSTFIDAWTGLLEVLG